MPILTTLVITALVIGYYTSNPASRAIDRHARAVRRGLARSLQLLRPARRRPGAGASADRRAAELRTPAVRLAELAGIPTQRGQGAARYQAGAEGERRTAEHLAPLASEGWSIFHDRALPADRSNVDHVAVDPHGRVYVIDAKLWASRYAVTTDGAKLLHGGKDVTSRLEGVQREARAVAAILGVRVVPVIALHGAPLRAGGRPAPELVLDGVRIVPAERLTAVLRQALPRRPLPGQRTRAELAAHIARALPPYTA
ncbi:nuclease-related domain-containing protein [Streptomyces sp. NPDC001552]|uniref:nuclease-related domain-containing protein n=1 Tax=Streptomyces sp. NPDC001552 TaxID=3364587 RepID=UPI00367FE384